VNTISGTSREPLSALHDYQKSYYTAISLGHTGLRHRLCRLK